ncbi:MAG: MFS transporter [Deltaproteobacteria bacterium]|nr:MFS transporter [Deltaproteobacteria bacterium]
MRGGQGRGAAHGIGAPEGGLRRGALGIGAAAFSLLGLGATAWANGGHAHGPERGLQVPLAVWLVGIGLTILLALLLVRQARRDSEYLRLLKGFSRNAKLLIFRSPFSGLSVSMWRLLFYLYLLAMGHDTLFVAQLASINWVFHGLSVIPSGILSDLFGRRRVFLVSYAGNILATAGLMLITGPTALLVLAAVQGAFEGGHAIVGPPFMVEQSRPDERVHLFSIDGFMKVGAASLGNLSAGLLPVAFGGLLGLGAEHAWAFRASLLCAIPVMLLSVIPIYLIDEQWQRIDIKRWWKNLESYGNIGMLALTEAGTGLALGMTAPFFNVFFAQQLRASTAEIGLIFALGSILTAFATLMAPLFVRRLGRVRTVAFLKFLGVPFLVLIGLSQGVVAAGIFYVLAIILIGGAFPNKALSDPIYSLFSMEVVKERERGTTNGIMHAFSEFPMGVGAWIAGPFMAAGNWAMPYYLAGAIYALAFLAFYGYFLRVETVRAVAVESASA